MSTGVTEARRRLRALLGDWPAPSQPPAGRVVAQRMAGTYRLEHLVLELNGREPAPAYLTIPVRGEPPFPVVLFNHSHGGRYDWGKEEYLRGNAYLQPEPYADALAARGIAGLCIDHWLFGERHGAATESDVFKEMLWQGQVLWGMMVYDSLRALDYLGTRRELDAARIATLGMSMGSTMAWWLAALDERVRVCIDLCCLTDFQALIEARGLAGHGIYYYVPSLLKHFTTAQINALIAPRPHLTLAGADDPLTPVSGLRRVDAALRAVYEACGAPANWRLHMEPGGHQETPAMRRAVLDFLAAHL